MVAIIVSWLSQSDRSNFSKGRIPYLPPRRCIYFLHIGGVYFLLKAAWLMVVVVVIVVVVVVVIFIHTAMGDCKYPR
jgi:hypothetical protein